MPALHFTRVAVLSGMRTAFVTEVRDCASPVSGSISESAAAICTDRMAYRIAL